MKIVRRKLVFLLLVSNVIFLSVYLTSNMSTIVNICTPMVKHLFDQTPVANLNGTLEDPNVSFNPVFNSTLHIYTIDNKPLLFVYWNKNEFPPHIQLSLETIKCHCHNEIHVVMGNPKFALSQLSESKQQFSWLIPAHQADYYRSSMLLKYGGMYMDVDSIQTNSVRYLFDYLVKLDVFGADWWPEGAPISITNIGPQRAGNLLLSRWKLEADKILKDKYGQLRNYSIGAGSYPIAWPELLGSIWIPIWKNLTASKLINYTIIDGVSTYGQLVANGYIDILFHPITNTTAAKAKTLNFSVDFMFYFNNVMGSIPPMDEFLSKNFLFTEIIKKAISQCKAWRNGLYDSDLIRRLNISSFNNFTV